MKKVLVTGARGQLAGAMWRSAPVGYECVGITRDDLDIADANVVSAFIEAERPDLIVNGAAYNAVDKAQGEGAADALAVNSLGVANLALACRDAGARLVHFSTDFVFDGTKTTPYLETDATNPLSVYGASKLCGENICVSTSPRNLAIRVCRLFGPVVGDGAGSTRKPGGNFPLLMLRLAKERGSVRVVDDQIGSPTYTPDLAQGVWELIQSTEDSDGGLFQLSNAGEVSFADYAAEIFSQFGISCPIERIATADYGAPAGRPLYSTLSNQKAHDFGVKPLRHWSEALGEFLSNL